MTNLQRNGLRNRYLLASDALLLFGSVILAFAIRFEGWVWPNAQHNTALLFAASVIPLKLGVFYWQGLYRRIWRHAGVAELEDILGASAIAAALSFAVGGLILPGLGLTVSRVPLSVLFMDAFMTMAFVATPRLLVRVLARRPPRRRAEDALRVLIVGAGAAGELITRELLGHPQLRLAPIGFVDDDPLKQGHKLLNLPVLGTLADIARVIERYEVAEVIVAMPRAPGGVVRKVLRAAQHTGVKTRTVPAMYDILAGNVTIANLRPIEIQDLLRRDTVQVDIQRLASLATGETVLVTGAGGSIGSELCRQLSRLTPRRVLLLGHGENSIFDILHELEPRYPDTEFVPIIADVRDRDRLHQVFDRYRPHTVFHAAAHKHVPLMECNVVEAVTNNVLGTKNVAELAAGQGVQHLVMISTDKAVRPTNVMGATKRVAEQIVQEIADLHQRNFVAVRFGNVLGSRGSVVPTFLQQIRSGGPVMVTHPEMRRYFMTIPESVALVLQAGAMGTGGEVFVLDMGEPVRIVDLATDMIRLSGLTLGEDIEIRFSGVRPGEKLYEELFFSEENAERTEHPKVLRAKYAPLPFGLETALEALVVSAKGGAADEDLLALLQRLVPDFRPLTAPVVIDQDETEVELVS